MSYGTSSTSYLGNDILSRSPEWLVPLLYEHLVINLKRAGVCIDEGSLEGKSAALGKANEIVMELASSLDAQEGGEIAKQLGSLYAFLAGEILEIGRTLDRGRLDRLAAMIAELHEAWVQAAEQVAPRARVPAQIAARG